MEAQMQKRPLVVTVGCNEPERLRELLGIETPFVDKLAGGRVLIQSIGGPGPWWSHPDQRENLVYLLFEVFNGQRTPNFVRKWIDSDKFVDYVRNGELLQHPIFNDYDPEDTQIVVIGRNIDTDSEHVRRVFDGLFPNADYYEWHASERLISPIWRDAVVAELRPSPALSEFLEWPPEQLPGLAQVVIIGLRNACIPTVRDLVMATRHELGVRGLKEIDLNDLAIIFGGMFEGLHYGITAPELQRLIDAEECSRMKPKSFPMRYDHGFSDETLLGG